MATKKPKETDPNAIAVRTPRAARMLDVSNRALQRMIETGELKSFRCGRMRLIRRKTIEEFCATREAESQAS